MSFMLAKPGCAPETMRVVAGLQARKDEAAYAGSASAQAAAKHASRSGASQQRLSWVRQTPPNTFQIGVTTMPMPSEAVAW